MTRDQSYGAAESRLVDEPTAWSVQKDIADSALKFWNTFMDLRQGPDLADASQMPPIPYSTQNNPSPSYDHLMCIIRAVSWVESQHGTGAGASAAVDPMQCGNKNDVYWQELTGQATGSVDRFVGGPLASNYDAPALPAAAAAATGFPANAALSVLTNPQAGHDDPGFNAAMSYTWGIIFLIHKINTQGDPSDQTARTYKCRDVATASDPLKTRFINGAVAYNGGGDVNYGQKITDALNMIGCVS